jgi:hypothetical protein
VITALTLVSVISTTVILIAIAVNPTLSNGLLTKSFIFKPVIETSPAQPPVIITTAPASPVSPVSPASPVATATVITGSAATTAATAATTATTAATAATTAVAATTK